MHRFLTLLMAFVALTCTAQSPAPRTVIWSADDLPPIRDFFGAPQVFQTAAGQAVHFSGQGDAAFVDSVRKADGKGNVLLLHAGDFNQDGRIA